MDWQSIKRTVYFCDGSLRDLYVLNVTNDDWRKWIELVNENYPLTFHDWRNKREAFIIDYDRVAAYMSNEDDTCVDVSIKVGCMTVKCYFAGDDEIENDIDPCEVVSIDDHLRIVQYMITVSKRLNKPVIMTIENARATTDSKEDILMQVAGEYVTVRDVTNSI